MISPASSYSTSPSTPNGSPYTPLTGFPLGNDLYHSASPLSLEDGAADMSYLEYNANAFGWETAGMWPSTAELVSQDEYDINAIPPVELCIPTDYNTESSSQQNSTLATMVAMAAAYNNGGNPSDFCSAPAVAPCNDLFSGMFTFSEPMMW